MGRDATFASLKIGASARLLVWTKPSLFSGSYNFKMCCWDTKGLIFFSFSFFSLFLLDFKLSFIESLYLDYCDTYKLRTCGFYSRNIWILLSYIWHTAEKLSCIRFGIYSQKQLLQLHAFSFLMNLIPLHQREGMIILE